MQIAIGKPPRRRKTKTMFELQGIKSAKHRSPYDSSYKCTHGTIGFFASVELAEVAMAADVEEYTENIKSKYYTKWERPFAYMIYERSIQKVGRKRTTWLSK